MGTYRTLAIAGNFDYNAMPDSIQLLIRNTFNPDPCKGRLGHWPEVKHVALMRGLSKEDFVRIGAMDICEWEWNGSTTWSQTMEKGLSLRSITMSKISNMGAKAIINILKDYVKDSDIFALVGSFNEDDGAVIERYYFKNNELFCEILKADDYYFCEPFKEEILWTKEKDLRACLTLTSD